MDHVLHEYANCHAENSRGQKIRLSLLISASRADAPKLLTHLEVNGFRAQRAESPRGSPFQMLVASDLWGDEAELAFGYDALDPDTFWRARKSRVRSDGVPFLSLEDRAVLGLLWSRGHHDGLPELIRLNHNSALMEELGTRYGIRARVDGLLATAWEARTAYYDAPRRH